MFPLGLRMGDCSVQQLKDATQPLRINGITFLYRPLPIFPAPVLGVHRL